MIYPVPVTNGNIKIKSEINPIGTIKIFDVLGKLLHSQNIELNKAEIDISYLAKGVYLLKTATTTNRFVVN